MSNHNTAQCRRNFPHKNSNNAVTNSNNYPQMQNNNWGPMGQNTACPQGFGMIGSDMLGNGNAMLYHSAWSQNPPIPYTTPNFDQPIVSYIPNFGCNSGGGNPQYFPPNSNPFHVLHPSSEFNSGDSYPPHNFQNPNLASSNYYSNPSYQQWQNAPPQGNSNDNQQWHSNKKNKQSEKQSNKTKTIASVRGSDYGNLPIIEFTIEGIKINALLDTGGAVSLLSNDLFEELKQKDVKMKFLGNRINIQSFSGEKIPFKKCVKLTFKLNEVFTSGTFYVTTHNFRGNYKMLLGFDYIKNNHLILDMQHNCLKIKNVTIPLTNENYDSNNCQVNASTVSTQVDQAENEIDTTKKIKSHGKKKPILARIAQRVFLAPGREKIVRLLLSEDVQLDSTILFEPINFKNGISCENSIHETTVNNDIYILIKNNSDKKIILQARKIMGKIIKNFEFKEKNDSDDIENGTLYEINSLSIEEVRNLREAELEKEDFDLSHLSEELRQTMESVLMKHAHAFSKSYKTLGQTSLVAPRIKLHHDYPIQCKPYKTPQTVREYAQEEIKKLLEANIIEKSDSNYAFPVLFVKKKSVDKHNKPKFRMAIDYRLINQILEAYPYKTPDIKELLQKVSGKKYYTVLDLHSAFFQINLCPEDKEKLAFITEDGKYRPARLPFGLKISSTRFAELIDKVLGHFNKEEVGYFIDDLILCANSMERMIDLLKEVLQALINNNLTVEPNKMQICQEEIEFLGFKINKNGYSPSTKNIEKIQKLATPKNKKGVKSLLGLANYFRTLIKNYSEMVHPLVELTKENVKFKWTEEAEKALRAIQNAIVQNPTLRPPDFSKEFYVITDGSKVAISGILAQKEGDEFKPIEFYGRKLKDSEKKYPSIKYELLAIHDTVKYFENILIGRKFTILTDSKALTHHINLEKQSDITARWLMKLEDFDYSIQHIKGSENPSDFISRHINSIQSDNELKNNLFQVNINLSDENIKEEQRKDSKLSKIINKIENNKQNRMTKKFTLNENEILILKQQNQNKELLIAPNKMIFEIIQEAHKSHLGFPSTYALVKARFFWFGMYRDIRNYCASCIPCNQNKQHQAIKVPIQKIVKDYPIGSVIQCDIVGKLPMTFRKNCFVLTIIDAGSRYLEAVPLRNVESQTILNALNQYFSNFGIVKTVCCDNGGYFKSKLFLEYMHALNIEVRYGSVWKPTTQGLIECQHKGLKDSITSMCRNSTEWDTRLSFFKLAHNTAINRATKYTPALLFFAREIQNHFTVLNTTEEMCSQKYVKNRIAHMKEIRKLALANEDLIQREYVGKNLTKIKNLELGDQVYVKQPGIHLAMTKRWEGPYEVVNKFRNQNYLLQHLLEPSAKKIKRHISHLFKPAAKANLPQLATEDSDNNSVNEEIDLT